MFLQLLPRAGVVARRFVLCCLSASLIGSASAQLSQAQTNTGSRIEIRFVDSATGAEVRPGTLQVERPDREKSVTTKGEVKLGAGLNTLSATAPGYNTIQGEFDTAATGPYKIRFLLDPIEEPVETRPETIETLRRHGYMLVQGFVVADDSGELLEAVTVSAAPSGVETRTDARGFFRFQLPAGAVPSAATLTLTKPGYALKTLSKVELWSAGDVTYRLRLETADSDTTPNDDHTTNAESGAIEGSVSGEDSSARAAPGEGLVTEPFPLESEMESMPELAAGEPLPATLPANATVRVPRNIRVLNGDGVTIDYVSMTHYTRAVLGSEWIASWGSYPGGSNSLNAGAVVIRCYAISRINNASPTSNYDICGTSSCQVYNPTKIHSYTDAAVYFTADWVLVSGGAIAGTEYSAENNSLDLDGASTFSCPDGFTAPTGSCLYDPVCAGQDRFGHGRGMCQWGSARWATGRRMHLRSSGDATPNGYPRRDWKWIVQHYYPQLTLLKGAALITGDDVKAARTVDVRACPGGEITNGTACALVTTKSSGATGVIVGGPVTVASDGKGFTWYRVQWNDASSTTGWTVENHLQRVFSAPAPPSGLSATGAATNRIALAWTDPSNVEAGFEVERAPTSTGPWMPLVTLPADATSYTDTNLLAGNTWHYRVRAYNAASPTAFGNVASATTLMSPPGIAPMPPATIPEEQLAVASPVLSETHRVIRLADFDAFMSETANGTTLFRTPRYSGSTSALLETAPDVLAVTDAFPPGLGSGNALRAQFAFNASANPWLRLPTTGVSYFPNPVISTSGKLRFKVYSDKTIRLAAGIRETTTPAGTAIGADGGAMGVIEWAGVTNVSGTAPMPSRMIPAKTWMVVTFDFPNEPITSFSSGNGVLSTASGLGVLEHLAIVPSAGPGVYNVYFDDFEVLVPRGASWSLDTSAPEGASINPGNGTIAWTPTEAQGPGSYSLRMIAADNTFPSLRATNSWNVTVTEVNKAPLLTQPPVTNFSIYAGATLTLTNSSTDPDLPVNTLTYGVSPGAPAEAQIDPATGLFTWTTSDDDGGTTYELGLRVTDNGTPALTDLRTIFIEVKARPQLTLESVGESMGLTFQTIPGENYVVQYKDNLTDPTWLTLTSFTANASFSTLTNTMEANARFYRIVVP